MVHSNQKYILRKIKRKEYIINERIMKRKCRKFIIGALIIMSVSLATSNAFAISSNQSNENQESTD